MPSAAADAPTGLDVGLEGILELGRVLPAQIDFIADAVQTEADGFGADGDFLDAAAFDSLAPASGKAIAQIAACGDSDVERAVIATRRAFESGKSSSLAPSARKTVLGARARMESNSAENAPFHLSGPSPRCTG